MRASRLLLPILLVALAGCPHSDEPAGERELPDQVVEGFVMHESSSGERLYTLEADTAYVFEVDERVDVVVPTVTFYDEAGEVHAVLHAKRGAIYSQNSNLVARGEVRVETADSTVLLTDSLSWSNVSREVRTDAPARPRRYADSRSISSLCVAFREALVSHSLGAVSYTHLRAHET